MKTNFKVILFSHTYSVGFYNKYGKVSFYILSLGYKNGLSRVWSLSNPYHAIISFLSKYVFKDLDKPGYRHTRIDSLGQKIHEAHTEELQNNPREDTYDRVIDKEWKSAASEIKRRSLQSDILRSDILSLYIKELNEEAQDDRRNTSSGGRKS